LISNQSPDNHFCNNHAMRKKADKVQSIEKFRLPEFFIECIMSTFDEIIQ